jgi:hypothetical protein
LLRAACRRASASILAISLLGVALSTSSAHAFTISSGTFTENFSDPSYFDSTNSTGLWNAGASTPGAEGGRFANQDPTKPITFGDGSDGTVNTSSGYTFNTDTHPNGYNFVKLTITGGTITVTGSNRLIIRSLTTVTISPTVTLSGSAGTISQNGAGTSSPGGTAGPTCITHGGAGGDTSPGNGQLGTETGAVSETGGTGNSGATSGTAGSASANSSASPVVFETAGSIVCGSGGAGGGGHAGSTPIGTGGGGGGGAGTLQIAATGNINVTSVVAQGGAGGDAITNSGRCTGAGAGGGGGTVWFQTLGSITAPASDPNIAGGLGGSNAGCGGATSAGLDGVVRGDVAGVTPWSFGYNTTNYIASSTYTIQSRAYDLGTENVGFFQAPTVTSSGAVIAGYPLVEYAGSSNGTTFSSFSSNILTLSNKGYRYLKWRITLQTNGAAATQRVTGISISFAELGIRLIGGCHGPKNLSGKPTWLSALAVLPAVFLSLFGFLLLRRRSHDMPWRIRAGIAGHVMSTENEAIDRERH